MEPSSQISLGAAVGGLGEAILGLPRPMKLGLEGASLGIVLFYIIRYFKRTKQHPNLDLV